MAKTTHVVISDDISGEPDPQTYKFSLGNDAYEIDLAEKNAAKLEKALAPFIEKAAKTSGRRRASAGGSSGACRNDLADVRVWAKRQKLDVSERGRIPKAVLEAYDAAH